MASREPFDDVVDRLRVGDGDAASEVHRRFVRRLVSLANRQFDPGVRFLADHEDVVQSTFRSFFARCERGEFELTGWEDLWSVLVVITVRKCHRRRRTLHARRRDVRRELARVGEADGEWEAPTREPTPAEAAMLAETVERWLTALEPEEQPIMALAFQGYSTAEISDRLRRSERTVRRVRLRVEGRLKEHIGA